MVLHLLIKNCLSNGVVSPLFLFSTSSCLLRTVSLKHSKNVYSYEDSFERYSLLCREIHFQPGTCVLDYSSVTWNTVSALRHFSKLKCTILEGALSLRAIPVARTTRRFENL